MGDLKVSVSKGKTVATLLTPSFHRCALRATFKTMAYMQANILLCALYMTPKEDLFERALTRDFSRLPRGPLHER